jgi:rubredoxin
MNGVNVKLMVWTCGNCGHEEPIPKDGSVGGLVFEKYSRFTSKLGCPACGSYTLQQATDGSFTVGHFLIVKTKNRIQGKGR